MRILLVHQNFPGQFLHLAPALLQAGHQVAAIGSRPLPPAWQHSHPALLFRCAGGEPAREQPQLAAPQRHLAQWQQGERVAVQLQGLAAVGWQPDLVLGHPFWGDLLHLDRVFPRVPLLALLELDLSGLAGVTALDQWAEWAAIRRMRRGLTSTRFQHQSYPGWLQGEISVIHEGIDVQCCRPAPLEPLVLPDGTVLDGRRPVLSYASRHLEPLRGFDTLLEVLPAILAAHPSVEVVICGQEGPGYGTAPAPGTSWRQVLQGRLAAQGGLDWRRVHWAGLLPHGQLLQLFRLSSVHLYLSRPYVLSWSLLEAMACGALVVAIDTPAVRDAIEPDREGWLVPPGQPGQLVQVVLQLLRQPQLGARRRLAARRRIVEQFALPRCLEQRIALVEALGRDQGPGQEAGGDG